MGTLGDAPEDLENLGQMVVAGVSLPQLSVAYRSSRNDGGRRGRKRGKTVFRWGRSQQVLSKPVISMLQQYLAGALLPFPVVA